MKRFGLLEKRLSFLRKQESILFSKTFNWILVFTEMTQLKFKRRFKGILQDSRGISVLFLIIAMLLIIIIGYVLAYLIPTKQKSVVFPIQSTQAFFIAQSGVEFAVKYAITQTPPWTTPAQLNGLDGMTRNLGAGRFVLDYDSINDKLTSAGEVPNGTEKRRIIVSNFTSFLMRIDYFASASTPPDNGTNNTNPTVVIPPAGMQAGDLVLMIAQSRDSTATIAISNAGGQSWTSEAQQNQTNCRIRLFWCRFNGTWTANPSVSFGNTNPHTVVMHVFRPSNTNSVWEVDVPQVSGNYTAPPPPYTVTIPGITTITDGALVFATWASSDDNRWGSLTGGWSTPGSAQYRNRFFFGFFGSSQTHAYRVMTIAGATGNVSKNQLTLGGDAGAYLIIAFRARVV
jgi:hypothetical protein